MADLHPPLYNLKPGHENGVVGNLVVATLCPPRNGVMDGLCFLYVSRAKGQGGHLA